MTLPSRPAFTTRSGNILSQSFTQQHSFPVGVLNFFHLLHFYVPLSVLQGIYHYWQYFYVFQGAEANGRLTIRESRELNHALVGQLLEAKPGPRPTATRCALRFERLKFKRGDSVIISRPDCSPRWANEGRCRGTLRV